MAKANVCFLQNLKMMNIISAKASSYCLFICTLLGGGRGFAKKVCLYARENDEKRATPF